MCARRCRDVTFVSPCVGPTSHRQGSPVSCVLPKMSNFTCFLPSTVSMESVVTSFNPHNSFAVSQSSTQCRYGGNLWRPHTQSENNNRSSILLEGCHLCVWRTLQSYQTLHVDVTTRFGDEISTVASFTFALSVSMGRQFRSSWKEENFYFYLFYSPPVRKCSLCFGFLYVHSIQTGLIYCIVFRRSESCCAAAVIH